MADTSRPDTSEPILLLFTQYDIDSIKSALSDQIKSLEMELRNFPTNRDITRRFNDAINAKIAISRPSLKDSKSFITPYPRSVANND